MKKPATIIISCMIILLFCSRVLYAKKLNILVNPFQNSGSSEYSWISNGITDTVISDLYSIKGFSVISDEDRANALKEMELGQTGILKDATAVKIGSLTGADLVFTGGYRVTGENIRVDAKLIQVKTGKVIKSFTLNGTLKEILKLQDKIVLALLTESKKIRIRDADPLEIKKEELQRISKKYKPAFTAYEWYCRGLEARYIEPKRAFSFFKKAISIDKDYVDALMKAGYISGRTLDRFSEALGFLKRAEGVLKKSGQEVSPKSAYLQMVYGVVSSNKGDYNKAEKHYLKSRNLYEKLNFKEHMSYSVLLINLGQHYEYRGNKDEALDSYFKAKDLLEMLGLHESSHYSALLNNIGIVFGNKGKYKRALEFYNQSKELKEKLNLTNSQKYSLVLNNIGISFFYMRNLKKALQFYLQAKKLRERLGLTRTKEYASILMNIGNIYAKKKKYNRAIPLFKESQKIWKELNLVNTKSYSRLLMNFGTAYRSQKQRKRGLSYYKQSKKLMEKLGLENTTSYGNLLLNMGVVYYNMKERKTACQYFDLAYQTYKRAKFKGKLKKTAQSFTRQCKKNKWY